MTSNYNPQHYSDQPGYETLPPPPHREFPQFEVQETILSTISAIILASAILITGLVLSAAMYLKPEHVVTSVDGKPWVYVVERSNGNVRLCGPEACVRVRNRTVAPAQ